MSVSFASIEALESRTFLSATLVRLATNYGNIDVQLTDDVTPVTVQNFLNYVNSGRFKNTIIHRNSGAVIQGGGYVSPTFASVVKDAPIANEFQAGVTTNIRGTIGMAKSADPNSATSQFFINLSDNSASFDNPLNAGGFTTFGSVTAATMQTVDTIAAIPVSNVFADPFDELPLVNYSGVGNPKPANLVIVKSATVLGAFSNSVALGGNTKVVTFTDADGTFTTIKLRGATGTLVFNGANVFQSTNKGKTTITGDNLSIASLNYASTGAAVLNVGAVGGNGSVDLPAMTLTGTTTQFLAPRANLIGQLAGDNLGNIVLGSISGGSVVSNGAALAMRLRVGGGIADGDVTTPGYIASLITSNWTDSTGTASALSAASVGSLAISGTMAADVTLNGGGTVLNLAKLGTSSGGTWTLSGNVRSFTASAFTGGFTANAATLVKIGSLSNASLNFVKPFDGFSPALGRLTAGTISASSIRSNDHIGAVTASVVDNSIISAGINFAADTVTVPGDFLNAARIASFKSGTFNNSALIAQNLGQATLGTTSDGVPTRPFFGVAADTILTLKLSAPGGKLFLKTLNDPAAVAGLIAAQNVTLNNLQVRVV